MPDAASAILEIGRALSAGEQSLDGAADAILAATGADRVSFTTISADDAMFELRLARGAALLPEGTRFPLETSTHFSRAAGDATFVATDFSRQRGFSRPVDRIVRAFGFRSGVGLPLRGEAGGGALSLHFRSRGPAAERAAAALEPILPTLAAALARRGRLKAVDVLVLHDDPLVGRGIVGLLHEREAFRARLCGSIEDAIAATWWRAPDVLVAEAVVRDESVDRWIGALRGAGVAAPLLVVSGLDSDESLAAAWSAGAVGYLAQESAEHLLAAAVEAAARGGAPVLPPREQPADGPLTPREREVLDLLDRGFRLKQIGVALGISYATTKTHTASIFRKLGVTSRGEASYEARRRGLLRG